MKKYRRIFAALLAAILLAGSVFAAGEDLQSILKNTAAAVQKQQADSNDLPAGNSVSDWNMLALARAGLAENAKEYLKELRSYVEAAYRESGGLDRIKATEWHRTALTVLALGDDPTAFGKKPDGTDIDLIADGTYNWCCETELGTQGLNAWIFALITLDAGGYEIPADARYQRGDILRQILDCQLEDGGFNLTKGGSADADLTAMALQALAPYKESCGTQIEKALNCLSALQQTDGGFSSWGCKNSESIAQAIIALTALGIDPERDARFIKNGTSIVSALLAYRTADGMFSHDETMENDLMATEQAMLALEAQARLRDGRNSLYDMRDAACTPERNGANLILIAAAAAALLAGTAAWIIIRRKRRVKNHE